jgi:WD40 repeat protein
MRQIAGIAREGAMNIASDVRVVRVFVSSPIDVAPERGRAQAVAAKLNREYEGLVKFETVLWEERFYTADKSFQPQITEPMACDIVVSIFWTRIGTEQPADFPRMPDGRPYASGTAYELLTALEASKSKGVPDVYVFRKTADAPMPTADAERRRQAQTQLDALEAFWSEWFKAETGQFKAAFQSFATTDEFEQQLEKLLRQWLETHGLIGPRLAWPKEKGSPFRGLAPFEAEYAAVFFGRDRVIDEARRRLNAAAERGAPFLLIVGASGAGKSSLARAGLIPRLTTPGVVASVDAWRVARMKPSEGGAGPLMALATALLAADALPELTQGDYPTPAALADNLARGGEASTQPIVRALARVAEEAQRERHTDRALKPALVLLVDQFEELFAQGVSDQERTAFAQCIKQLVGTGQVWCVATLRADLYEFLLKQPVLKTLKEAGTSLDLGPPGAAELAEIVRAPAAAAGLIFERDTDKGELDERLLADAKSAESLPLLQFTLRQLYDLRVEVDSKVKLTHAAYDALGRLEGAIAAEAEQAVAKLPATSLEALPRLVRLLAEPARDGKALTLREVPRSDVAVDSGEAALVDALLGARILIARRDAEERPTVRLAHDAVLASWPRAKDAAQASRDFYRVRTEVEDALRRWHEYDRPKDRLIQPGVPLAEAEKLVENFGRELPAELTGYVIASRHRARARQRLIASAAIFFFVLALAAGAAAKIAYDRNNELHRAQGEINEKLQQAFLNESRFLTNAAEDKVRDSNFDLAGLLARAALPADMTQPDRKVWPPALDALQQVAQRDPLRMVLDGTAAMFSPDGQRMLTWYEGRGGLVSRPNTTRPLTKLWDVPSGALIIGYTNVRPGAFSSNSKWLVIRVPDNNAKVLEARTGAEVAVLKGHSGSVISAQFSPDDSFILTTSLDGTARLWSTTSFETESILTVERPAVADFSADGQQIMFGTDNGSVLVFDRATGRKFLELIASEGEVDSVKFSPDAKHALVITKDNSMQVWDLATRERIFVVPGVDQATFSPDGGQILTTESDWSARLWDAVTGKAGLVLKHEAGVHDAAFSPDGKYVLTASDDAVRIWESETGQVIAILRGLVGLREQMGELTRFDSVAISPDGQWIAGTTGESEVRVWKCCTQIIRGRGKYVNAAQFSPTGKYVVTAFAGSNVAKVWNANTGMLASSIKGHGGEIWSAQFSPDNKRIVSLSKDHTARIWDAYSGEPIAILQDYQDERVQTAKFTLDGRYVVTTRADGKTRIWNAETGSLIQVLDFWFLAISTDARQVAVLDTDGSVDILDLSTGGKVKLLDIEGVFDLLPQIEFSVDGKRIIIFWGSKLYIRDTRSGSNISVIDNLINGASNGIARFSPDGRRVITVSGNFGQEVEIWDAETGAKMGMLEGHSTWINDVEFSPDGNWIVTASADSTARLWDAHTGASVAVFKGHDAAVNSAAFSSDSQTIVTASPDGTAQLWTVLPLSSSELADYSSIRAVRDFTKAERAQYSVPDDPRKAEWMPATGSFNDCDRLAAFPRDPQKRAWGVAFENIKEEAVGACRTALAEHPDDPSYMYQLARALAKAGDTAESRALFERAAARGYAAAHNNLGSYYEKGELGFTKNGAAAISHYAIAFKGGVRNCADVIARMYREGEGVDRDRKLALDWVMQGAAAGSPSSHHTLAYLYEHGEDVGRSLDLALFHRALAERLYTEAELRGTESRGSADYSRVRRIALSRDLPAKNVAIVAGEVFRWTPTARP